MTDEPVLDQPGGMPDLMAAVMDMQAGMQAAQAELAAALLTGSAGGGLVTAQIRGTGELVSVPISPTTSRCSKTWSSPRSTTRCVSRPSSRPPP
jgi:YbaB/EbfC DNA-binding family